MTLRSTRSLIIFALLLAAALPSSAQKLPSIVEKTENMQRFDGFFPIYWDEQAGKIWLEIPRLEEDFIYVVSQPAGLGSNDIGLDRTQLGGERIVRFERIGPKILLVEPNLRFRASSESVAERASVRDAFADAVVWGFTAAAESDGRVLVDATDFIARDAHGVVRRLKSSGQGAFALDASRSAVYLPTTRAYPDNTEMEARLTFTSDDPGPQVRAVAADPYAITLRVRHSFVRLPPPGYKPRRFDPRSGFFGISYADYSVPIGEEMQQQFIARHRLEVDDNGEVIEPIVYHLDPGTPEPIRTALLDGARWWTEAFEAAGFPNAFRVEILPEGADPMDVRYNVIQWVHRATRGWSYGTTVTDPRTGEIIKGHVLLGSLRVRQDYLLAEGLLSPYGGDAARGYPRENDPMLDLALARIRQLSAHEIGHTLGIAHNFAASADGRASVMDYPAPLVTLVGEDSLSLADAYDVGIGEWDKVAIRYGYSAIPEGVEEDEALDAILRDAAAAGLQYITDADARPAGAAHPLGSLWDNGSRPVEDLRREMRVREVALEQFGEAALREGRPLAQLEEVLVPLYLRHRYQVEGTVKLLGGVSYSYALRGGGQLPPEPVSGAEQRAALEALLETVVPEALSLPERIRSHIPPRPPGYDHHRELFDGHTGLTFDPYAPAATAASVVFEAILNPQRAARLVYQQDADPSLPDLAEVLARVTESVWKTAAPSDPYDAEIQRIAQDAWVDELLDLAQSSDAAPAVRSEVQLHLRNLQAWIDEQGRGHDRQTLAHQNRMSSSIERFLEREYRPEEDDRDLRVPPGSPIGD